jgi:hypothetical protein
VLLGAKALSRAFFQVEVERVGERVDDPWEDIRVVALLNHTSLYEWLFTAVPPNRFLRRQRLPRLWKTIRLRLELVDIETYCRSFAEAPGSEGFKNATKVDLQRRRDLHCGTASAPG